MRMRRSVRNAWVQALRSGEYDQATGALCKVVGLDEEGTPKLGFCCLGVLSDLAAKTTEVAVHVDDCDEDVVGEVGRFYDHEVNYPPAAVNRWAFDGTDFCPPSGDSDGWSVSLVDEDSIDVAPHRAPLADANDGGATFAEIADMIENDLDRDGDVRDDLAEVTA